MFNFLGHDGSVFRIRDDTLYYTLFRPRQAGAGLAAYDLKAGAELWRTGLQGVICWGHSDYYNQVTLDVEDEVLVVHGHEAMGDYLEFVERSTGLTVGHRAFQDPKVPRPISQWGRLSECLRLFGVWDAYSVSPMAGDAGTAHRVHEAIGRVLKPDRFLGGMDWAAFNAMDIQTNVSSIAFLPSNKDVRFACVAEKMGWFFQEVEGTLTLAAYTNQPVLWMRYTPVEFGIVGDRVLAVRLDCRAFKSQVDGRRKKMSVSPASDGTSQ